VSTTKEQIMTDQMPIEKNPTNLITVRVRDSAAGSALWGTSGPFTPIIRTVQISSNCPACGARRGEIRGDNGCEDGAYYHVNVWDNPCGHIDYYPAVLREARMLAEALADTGLPE
jgi:hypothetical protein